MGTEVKEDGVKRIMVMGTQEKLDYLAFAHKGPIALALKLNEVRNGATIGKPGHVWIGARLRSCKAPLELNFMPSGDQQFGGGAHLGSFWQGVTWEKDDSIRASTQIGALFEGGFDTPDLAEKMLEQVRDGAVAAKLADYLIDLAGVEATFLYGGVDNFAAILQDMYFDALAADIGPKVLAVKKVAENGEGTNVGSFGMQATLLKKMAGKHHAPEPQADPDEGDGEDEEGEDDEGEHDD